MIKLARVVSTKIEKGFRVIKTKFGSNVVETSKEASNFGFDGNPVAGSIAVVSSTANNSEDIVFGYESNQAQEDLKPGESMHYSTDSDGGILSYMIMRNDGTANFMGVSDNLVRYIPLESAYDELKNKFNDLVTAFNSHLHPTAAVGPPSPPTPVPDVIPALPSTGDISAAKIDEITTLPSGEEPEE